MNWSKLVGGGFLTLMVGFLALPQAQAIEIVGGSNPAAYMNEDMISKVVVVRRGAVAYRGGAVAYRGGGVAYRGGGVAYRGGGVAYRRGGVAYRR